MPDREDFDLGTNKTDENKHQDEKAPPNISRPDAPNANIEARGGVGNAGRAATGPSGPLAPNEHLALKGAKVSGRPTHGSISPGIGYLYVLLAMFMIIGSGTLLSGGFVPVDPNGPGGPPTLDPYFNAKDYGEQKKIFPSNINRFADNNLQLKTFGVNVCGAKSAIMFVVDTSGSMKFERKMTKTQEAMLKFTEDYPGVGVIGLIRFSNEAQELIPLSKYKDVRGTFGSAVRNLKPDGYTKTRDAMQLAKQRLAEAIAAKKFPDYKYTLVLLTDGVPEQKPPRNCYVDTPDPNIPAPDKRCFAREQDPTFQPDITADIKNLGVTIYSINIYSPNYASDKFMYPHLTKLLKTVATRPEKPYYHESINAGDLVTVLKGVNNSICEQQGEIGTPESIR